MHSSSSNNNNYTATPTEAMVTCICQVGGSSWQPGEVSAFMEGFIKDHLLELRQTLSNNKYNICSEGILRVGTAAAATTRTADYSVKENNLSVINTSATTTAVPVEYAVSSPTASAHALLLPRVLRTGSHDGHGSSPPNSSRARDELASSSRRFYRYFITNFSVRCCVHYCAL